MFRELRRKKQELNRQECLEVLINEKRGVLSVNGDDGYPYGMPLNHFYNEEDGCLYFHGGKIGHRIDAIKRNDKVSYCVYDEGYLKEGEWSLNFKSVIVFGRMEIVEDEEMMNDIIRKLCYRFTDDEEYIKAEFDRSFNATLMTKLVPEHISGKRVNES